MPRGFFLFVEAPLNLRAFISAVSVATLLASCGAPANPKGANDPNAAVTSGPSIGGAKDPSAARGPLPIEADDPVRGVHEALVTIVEFSDFQCPYCARAQGTLERVLGEFQSDVRVVWKSYPLDFHEHARPASEVGASVFASAGNDAFWKYHDQIFQHQTALENDDLIGYAVFAGAQANTVRSDLRTHRFRERVARDEALGKQVGVDGTPAFFINGARIVGARPFAELKEIVTGELQHAKRLLEKGVKRSDIYAAATTENLLSADEARAREAQEEAAAAAKDAALVHRIPIGKSPTRGSANAAVTIVEFSDFQCPYCKQAEETLRTLDARYPGALRFVWKNKPLPFHKRAEPAAELALEARAQKGDAAFWEAHDRIFRSQPDLEDGHLFGIASEMKLDLVKVKRALATQAHENEIFDDESLSADAGVNSTPYFFLNGRKVIGASPVQQFAQVIEEEIGHAAQLVAGGVKAENVYDTIIEKGVSLPPPALEKKEIALSPNAPFRGAPEARVVIHQFSDFQCPFCSRVEPTLDKVLAKFPKQVKIVWHDLPLPMHSNAVIAAEAAREAKAQKGVIGFWRMHDKLFAEQAATGLSREALDGYAKEMGLDMKRWKKALDDHAHQAAVEADAKSADAAGIGGTPGFTINGYFVSGAQPYSSFRRVIERALSETK